MRPVAGREPTDIRPKMEWFLLIVAGLIALGFFVSLNDRRAKNAVKRYCEDHGIEVIELKVYRNAYGVYFRAGGKRKHARFQYGRDGIEWEGPSPVEIRDEAERD